MNELAGWQQPDNVEEGVNQGKKKGAFFFCK
jgi:hypothetical protein